MVSQFLKITDILLFISCYFSVLFGLLSYKTEIILMSPWRAAVHLAQGLARSAL